VNKTTEDTEYTEKNLTTETPKTQRREKKNEE
jgi:hypothetical protein